MTTRLASRTVTFARAFMLDEIDHEIPPGSYIVETEEETLGNLSFVAYRRTATRIFIPSGPRASDGMQMWTIHPDGLASALSTDSRGAA